jgi:catechol 2,3-dioxygenase-like lactoylglutathione lyase family enzyme
MMVHIAVAALAFGRSALIRSPQAASTRAAIDMVGLPSAIRAVDIRTLDAQSLAVFYETCFGMVRSHGTDGCLELGFPGDPTRLRVVEGGSNFRVGAGFDAIALHLPDVDLVVDRVEVRGGGVVTLAAEQTVGPSKIPDEPIGTAHVTYEALVSDPQGHRFRLIQCAPGASRVAKVVLRVTDLEKSQQFYSELLGMPVLRWRSDLQSKPSSLSLTMQFGDPLALDGAAVLEQAEQCRAAILELVYPFDTRKMDVGEGGVGTLTIAADGDVAEIATRAPSANGKLVRSDPSTGEAHLQDPDGFGVRLVAHSK